MTGRSLRRKRSSSTPGKESKFSLLNMIDRSLCRKNHSRAMESMQASLESEQKAKTESLRIKKKLEGDINEFEIALDHANKANNEAQKSIKRYQVNIILLSCNYIKINSRMDF